MEIHSFRHKPTYHFVSLSYCGDLKGPVMRPGKKDCMLQAIKITVPVFDLLCGNDHYHIRSLGRGEGPDMKPAVT